ncbi:MAG: hypothetical protein U0905_12325 [Pirellulales bacterium]
MYGNGVTIQGNTIGLSSTGAALGNGGAVSNSGGIIEAGGSSNVLIGGTGAGQGNTIASNIGDGIIVLSQTNTTILEIRSIAIQGRGSTLITMELLTTISMTLILGD